MQGASGLAGVSRRSFLTVSTAVSASVVLGTITEPMLAWAGREAPPKGAILLNANENPLGPSEGARTAAAAVVSQGGRYQTELADDLVATFARTEGLKPEYVRVYAGSSEPLHYTVKAFTSPTRSYVTADPGFEAGLFRAERSGVRVVQVRLTKTYTHDVRGMLAAAPDAGVFYICTPNNPTGTLTSHSDLEYLLEHKPKESVVLVDEAYIHFSDATSALDLVKADRELIVLRTFSKIYGLAGLRCGFAVGRPDLIEKMEAAGAWNFMPVPGVVAAKASLVDPSLVPERKRINAGIRTETFEWLDRNGYAYIPSESNCFLLNTKRPGKEAIDAMARENVIIGRVWPILPTWVRITVGTRPEMDQFQAAFKRVMNGTSMGKYTPAGPPRMVAKRVPVNRLS